MGLYDEDYRYPNALYDSETGTPKQKAHVDLLEVEEQEALDTAEALQSMRDSAGFKVIEKFLTEQVNQLKDSLPYVTGDTGKVYRMQEAIKCYQNVLDYLDHNIRVGMFHKQRDNSTK